MPGDVIAHKRLPLRGVYDLLEKSGRVPRPSPLLAWVGVSMSWQLRVAVDSAGAGM